MKTSAIKCVVVEDDPVARAIINKLITDHDAFVLLASFSNAREAAYWFQLHRNVDIIFMDVELKGESGIQLYQQLPYCPDIIFITAHEDFAFAAYELGAIDYIKKPVTRERFLRSFSRLQRSIRSSTPANSETAEGQTLFFKEGRTFVRLRMREILFFEASRDYVKIVTEEKYYMVLMTMNEMETKLDAAEFIRVSKSFIVNKHKIIKVENGTLYINQYAINISRMKKQEVKAALGLNS